MKRKSYRRRRDQSDSDSSSSYSDDSPERPEDLYGELKSELIHNDRYVYRTVKNISKHFRNEVGILRITISGTFTFSQTDIEDFFKKYGKIEKVIIKQNSKNIPEESKGKEQESIAYVIYSDYFSAVLALKVLNSTPEKERIIRAKLCFKNPMSEQEKNSAEPLLYMYKLQDMIVEIQNENEFGPIVNDYKYIGTIGLDLSDRSFKAKERILGVEGCNFVRIYYLCDKSFRFENEDQESHLQDLQLKLIVNKGADSDRDVLIMSHSLQKYNQAIRFLHELLEQIVEEYKNSREKSCQIIAKDIHIRRWEKFCIEPQLKFLT